jgi:hypothetical protein
MGLEICKSILTKLGGKIIINTEQNSLTSFKVEIPSQLLQPPIENAILFESNAKSDQARNEQGYKPILTPVEQSTGSFKSARPLLGPNPSRNLPATATGIT